MLTIQIKNGANEVIAVINDIYSLSVDDEVNKGGKLKLRFPTEKWLQKRPLQKGYRISVVYGEKIGQIVRLFEGYITDVTLKTQEVQIEADNRLSYLQYRMIKTLKKYIQTPISTVISDVFNTLNATHELPVTLGLNDCDTTITKDFEIGTSFYDILKFCREAEPKLVVRVLNVNNYNFLEVSKNAGKVLEGVREYDAKYTRGTNIVDWSRKDSMDEFYSNIKTATGEVINEDFINRTNLLFEKYEEEGAPALPNGIAIPSIAVSRETDRRDFNIWDRKNIRLLTWYERLPLQYQGLIQSRKVNINASTWIKAEIKISEDYKSDTNILDLVLQNLRGKKNTSGSAPDMSDYYTKEQTAVVINTAIAGKADVAHTHLVNQITDFASAVSSMITTALADYVTSDELSTILAYYSQVGHTHTTDDITDFTTAVNSLIAEGISGKADVNHRHTVADISDLDDTLADYVTLTALNTALANYVTDSELNTALTWKADATHSHAISDVTGLENALNSKADKTQIKNYAITEDIVTVTTDATKWVSPYNTSYGYTNITIDANAWIERKEGAIYSFVINTEMVVASAYRNVRVRIGDGAYIPVMGSSSGILAGSSYFAKTQTRVFMYKSTYQSNGALHMLNDTTYSTMSVAEGQAGTATSARTMRADYLKQIIQHRIPTALSAFTNDTNFITNAVNDLVNYYKKSDLYTKAEVNDLISGITWITVEVVQTLPATGQNGVFYLVPNSGSGQNIYDEYIRVAGQNKFEKLGTTEIDLSNYIQKTDNLFSINGTQHKYGDNISITKATVGLGNVDNTADAEKSVAHAGTADSATNADYATNAGKVNNHTVEKDVPSDAKFTDTTYNKATASADGLMSKEDFSKLSGIESGAEKNTVTWVKGSAESEYREGNVNITKANIGLGNVDNTADNAKPVSTAQKSYIDTEVGKKYDKLVEVTVSTWATTVAKVGTTSGGNYVPSTWDLILVNFVNGCNVSNPTLNIDASGAKNIRVGNSNADANTFGLGSTSSSNVKALFIYDGTYYRTFSVKNTTYTISDHKITLVQDGVELGYFTLNQSTDKTISRTSSGDEGQINATIVQNMIDITLGNYDNVFKTNSGLYKILNAIDEDDVLGLTEGETWSDIINNSSSMNLISHSYACMVDVSNSEYAMEALMEVSGAVDQVSQCRDSIYIIANNDKSANIYLGSATGIQYLFTYQQAQDAFFTNETRKQQIINDNIMVIVNSNTLLQSLYTDSVVAQAIAWNQTALNTIASNSTKLGIVDDSATIMDAIATNSGALGNMSDADFTTYILENTTYLTLTTSVTAGQNRINAMDADDLLPAIFYYTGLSWYSTFADLAANDWAINIVQSNANCMLIINSNDEALSYLKYYYKPTANTLALFYNDGSVLDSSLNNISLTTYGTMEFRSTWYKDRKYLYTNGSSGFYGNVVGNYTGTTKTLSCRLLCNNTSGWREAFAIGNGSSNGVINLGKSSTYTDARAAFYNTGWNDVYSRKTVNTTTWYNIIFVVNGTSYTMYVNGEKTNTGTISNMSYNNIIQVWGRNRGSNNENWIGGIGECIYENIARTDSQALTYFNKSKENYGL